VKKERITIFLAAATIIGGVVFFLNNRAAGNYDEFAKCLSQKEAAMYGAYWCGHCQNQKKMFGDSFKFVNYIECTENQGLCSEKGIDGYPTWIVNGQKYPGEMSFQKLSELTECNLNA